ncbi:hypothetical protein Nepgr_004701 [Nepenthes gracilis]|uniref:Uncharacterized protein n=1 Tax=Nepenthes gracilis TaxID=150966 RepID=A0AAD3XFM8_NEPGR|nr:hypothetical protein Nepgr_004701 [Nepenthes gracilis]
MVPNPTSDVENVSCGSRDIVKIFLEHHGPLVHKKKLHRSTVLNKVVSPSRPPSPSVSTLLSHSTSHQPSTLLLQASSSSYYSLY